MCGTLLCAAVGTASHQHGLEALQCVETLLCAAVATASDFHGLEALLCVGPYCMQLYAHKVISMCWQHVLCVRG